MSRLAPYLQRRGLGFAFRISVPPDLHAIVGVTEITRALPTSRGQAIPLALICAAHAKRLFCELRAEVASAEEKQGCHQLMDHDKLRKLMQEAKHKIRLDTLNEQHEEEIIEQRRQHLRELESARLAAENGALRSVLAGLLRTTAPSPAAGPPEPPAPVKRAPTPMFSAVVKGFLDKYPRDKSPAMYKKHKPVLSMLLEVIGDKPITELRQADLNEFFELLGNVPPRWRDECRKRKLSVRQLAELEHSITLGPKSFQDTYVASVRPFLKVAKTSWQDQGLVTTDYREATP